MLYCDLNAHAQKHYGLHLTTKDRARRNSLAIVRKDNALLHSFRNGRSDVHSADAEKENIRLFERRRVVVSCCGAVTGCVRRRAKCSATQA